MSAVVHTGSSEARSACGTKVIVLAGSALTMRGAASAVAPARADLRKLRRLTSVFLRRILTLLALLVPLGNQPRATLSAYPAFPCRALLPFLPSPRDAPYEGDGTRLCR